MCSVRLCKIHAHTHAHSSLLHTYRHSIKDLGNGSGTWLNGRQLTPNSVAPLHPGDVLEFGQHPASDAQRFMVKLQHRNYRTDAVKGHSWSAVSAGAMVQQLA